MSLENPTADNLRINEIKNHLYCPRIPFYNLCLWLDRETALSRIGIDSEAQTKQRMKRRKHALHAVHHGTRHFDVPVVYPPLQLIGRLDELVETPEGVYLVDYKDTTTDYGYWKIQMMAYRLGVEAQDKLVLGCYVYTIPNQQYQAIRLTGQHQRKLETTVQALRDMLASDICPPPTPHIQKCYTCQYRRFCNDIF